jgi:hypothetical protein
MSVGRRLRRNAPRALRAGFLAFAMAQLLVAVASTPWLSTHSEFAHAHPLGSGEHVHALDDVFAAGPAASPVRRVDVAFDAAATAYVPPTASAAAAPPSLTDGARAPPAAG